MVSHHGDHHKQTERSAWVMRTCPCFNQLWLKRPVCDPRTGRCHGEHAKNGPPYRAPRDPSWSLHQNQHPGWVRSGFTPATGSMVAAGWECRTAGEPYDDSWSQFCQSTGFWINCAQRIIKLCHDWALNHLVSRSFFSSIMRIPVSALPQCDLMRDAFFCLRYC